MNHRGVRQLHHRSSQYSIATDHQAYLEHNLQLQQQQQQQQQQEQSGPLTDSDWQQSSRFLAYDVSPDQRQSRLMFAPMGARQKQARRPMEKRRSSPALIRRPPPATTPFHAKDFISQLPNELIHQIVRHLDVHDLLTLGLLSHRWRTISLVGAEWHRLMQWRAWKFHLPSYLQPYVTLDRIDWRYWYMQRHRLEQRWRLGQVSASYLLDHTDGVYCVQFDDRKVVSGSRDCTIKIWDAVSFQCVRTLVGHDGSVLCLQYNQDYLISGSSDMTLIVWCMRTLQQVKRITGHTAKISDLCFNDKYVISGARDNMIRITRVGTWETVRVIHNAHSGHVNAVKMHGSMFVSASKDSTIKLWDIESGQPLQQFNGHTHPVTCVAFDGSTIVSGSQDNTIRIWNAKTGECVRTLEGHLGLVRALSFSQGRIVSASYDQSIRVWDMETGLCTLNFQSGHSRWVFDVKFDEKRIVSASQDHRILVMDFANGIDTRCIC
ncbi:WD40-repeat-containing domain protein [Gongronella butleri]|nr:WD40-repeat-containing domain protein [Gongronella butleri]